MISKTQPTYRAQIVRCFKSLSTPMNKAREEFMIEVLCLFLSLPKINFCKLARHTGRCEQRFRMQFAKRFNWLKFNTALVQQHCGKRLAIAFDPCYIAKAGKKTHGVGWFWSGCAGAVKRGLEICGIAALDLDNHTAMHILAVQTLPNEDEGQLEFYARILVERNEELQKVSNVVVADAFFSKFSFVDALRRANFHVVSRLRSDAVLTHIIKHEKTGKRGRPKTRGEKVDLNDLSQAEYAFKDGEMIVHTAVVRSKALKMNIRVVHVQFSKTVSKLFFSTDVTMGAEEILEIYRTRFQIEFLYRDAKQHTSLTACQAQSVEKLDFHFNASLSAINLAKAEHWYSLSPGARGAFSMYNIKTLNHNKLLIELILCKFGINPNTLKNKQYIKELKLYATIAA
jgi:hypothetical protein